MRSSDHKSSGVHWCRRRVRFNEVPEKVPKVPGKVWEALVEPGHVQQGSGEGSGEGSKKPRCKAKSGSTEFRRRFRRTGEGSGEGLGGFGAEPGQVQQGSGEGSGEGRGGFGAEPGQVQQGSGGSGRLWCRARSSSTGFRKRFREALVQSQVKFRRKFREALVQSRVKFNRVLQKVPEKVWEALVQSQVRFNRVSEKVPEKVWEALVESHVSFNRVPEKVWEDLVQSQVRFNRVPEKVPEKVWEALVQSRRRFLRRFRRRSERLWCRARSGSTGFVIILFTKTQLRCFQRLASQLAVIDKTLRLLGIPPKLIEPYFRLACRGKCFLFWQIGSPFSIFWLLQS